MLPTSQISNGSSSVNGAVLALAVPNVDDFAAEVGVSRGTLYLWRKGRRNPSPENLANLANALDRAVANSRSSLSSSGARRGRGRGRRRKAGGTGRPLCMMRQ